MEAGINITDIQVIERLTDKGVEGFEIRLNGEVGFIDEETWQYLNQSKMATLIPGYPSNRQQQ